ncbi:hypothetical protein K530_12607 [Streptomyces noursei CCRC 11814]|nr:hypothetical protein K530_12607 [Streptomyces noursei CCRC 11814]
MLRVAGVPDRLHHLAGWEREQCSYQLAVPGLCDQWQCQRQSSLLQSSFGSSAHQRFREGPVHTGQPLQQPRPALACSRTVEMSLLDLDGCRLEQLTTPVTLFKPSKEGPKLWHPRRARKPLIAAWPAGRYSAVTGTVALNVWA